jgi:hypothetical protein
MGYFDKFTSIVKRELQPKQVLTSTSVQPFSLTIAELPKIVERKNKDYVLWGEDNLYPNKLNEVSLGSAIHGAILKTKTKMTHGDGFLINGSTTKEESDAKVASLPANQKAEYDFLMKNKVGGESLQKVVKKLANDFQIYGCYAFEVLFNQDFTKIAGIKHVDVRNVRSGKLENGKVKKYYYSRDWSDIRNNIPKEIEAYYEGNKDSYNQLYFTKVGTLDYYGIPAYVGALNWIYTDMQLGIFHNANISNGMNPGLHFKFYKLPASKLEEDEIIAGIKKTWQGADKTGKMVATFSEGKETAMDIQPIEVSNLDKQLVHLAELCDKKILSAHQLTTPLLAGISVSGQLGGNTELELGYTIFDNVAMEADRQMISDDLQWIFNYNKTGIQIDINPFKPF